MTLYDALIKAVSENFHDSVSRMALADYMNEQGMNATLVNWNRTIAHALCNNNFEAFSWFVLHKNKTYKWTACPGQSVLYVRIIEVDTPYLTHRSVLYVRTIEVDTPHLTHRDVSSLLGFRSLLSTDNWVAESPEKEETIVFQKWMDVELDKFCKSFLENNMKDYRNVGVGVRI